MAPSPRIPTRATRLRLRQHGGDVLEELAKSLAVSLADEAARRQRLEPMATLTTDGARKASEAAKAGLPHDRPLVAPLILDLPATKV